MAKALHQAAGSGHRVYGLSGETLASWVRLGLGGISAAGLLRIPGSTVYAGWVDRDSRESGLGWLSSHYRSRGLGVTIQQSGRSAEGSLGQENIQQTSLQGSTPAHRSQLASENLGETWSLDDIQNFQLDPL
ncbi:hypothetical protein DSO57_1023322 [Entomophthora muscae]|uniref:Uncharacterized protein n=1 Tax=Entomophthora muscae TaxID=34485 RepID=A0ACC2TDR0_9FUNG|nr:hypothetical protein DSO57_1023322 [Entomophthora muscae]